MTDQTLQQSKGYENNQLQWGITERVFEIKPENRSEDMDYWFGKNKITASTQIRGIRFRWIRTTQDVGDSVKWKMFEDTLQNWDIRYDNVDRKIKAYSTDPTDLSFIPDRWVSQRWFKKWEYVLYNWRLYLALQDTTFTNEPWTPSWDWFRKLSISFEWILPYDSSSLDMVWWFTWTPIWSLWELWILYTSYTANDNFWLISLLPLVPTIPADWYYLINTRETRDTRPWWTDVMSRIELNYNLPWSIILSECYRYTPTISATSSWWIITTIDQWIIPQDTTSNTRMWYLNKWDTISVSVRALWSAVSITNDFLQITRLF